MRIGVDARPLTYRLTGIGVYLKHLLETLQGIDHENVYFLISSGPIDFDLKNPNWFKIEGRHKQKLISTLWIQFRAPIYARRLNLDLFWGTRHNLPLLVHKKTKTVVTIHDIVHRLYPGTMNLPNLLVERLLMKWSLLKADRIITDSRSTASGIRNTYKIASDKIIVVYPGPPPLINRATDVRRNSGIFLLKYFLFVGTLDPRKNFERIIEAFELTDPERHDVHLVIVGGMGWKNEAFFKKVKQHPLIEYIHLMGYVERAQLGLFYRNALCLLFPSLYEGFGLPILEAMACGTPVITSNISSMPEVAGNAALLVDPYDVDALAKGMQEILADEELRERLKKRGKERVKKFSWERCARDTLEVLMYDKG